ncbi:MAG: sigma-54 dependent transcriptional regulator [Deltaproteobacteria bacterium]
MTFAPGGESGEFARLNLAGESPAWNQVLRKLQPISAHDAAVLIEGETGTGKELVAHAIHYLGARREFPFIPLNCGALPDTLLESELFGHERGAFTDARERRTGLIAEADRGTLFLDEVEAMSSRAQIVLLRFLQDQTYMPLGGRAIAKADVRIVAASNANLEEEVARGRFRRDLWFRMCVLHLRLPPLRERLGDVRLLAQLFIDRCCTRYRRGPHRLSRCSLAALEARDWPGNVRELESVILREFLLHDTSSDELSVETTAPASGVVVAPVADFKRAKALAVAEFEREYLSQLLASTRGNISMAARMSRKDRSALNKLVKKHGLSVRQFRA